MGDSRGIRGGFKGIPGDAAERRSRGDSRKPRDASCWRSQAGGFKRNQVPLLDLLRVFFSACVDYQCDALLFHGIDLQHCPRLPTSSTLLLLADVVTSVVYEQLDTHGEPTHAPCWRWQAGGFLGEKAGD